MNENHRRAWLTARLVAEGLTLLVVFALLTVYVLRSMYGIDVFWHIKAGELIVESGAIPHVDTFSAVAPERPWTTFQWLYQVGVYGLDELGGYWALRLSHALVLLLGFAFLYAAVRPRLGPPLAVFVLTLTVALFEDRFRVRPDVFNLLFLALILPVLLDRWRRLSWKGTLGVGLVAWLWANLHAGGALLIPVSLGGLLAGAAFRWLLLERSDQRRAELFAALRLFVVAVVPMLFMPGFLLGVRTAVVMYGASVALIPEWQDPTAYFDLLDQRGRAHNLISGFATYVIMTIFGLWIVAGVLRKRIGRLPWPEIAVAALFLYLGQRSLRFLFLDVFAVILLLRAVQRWRERVPGASPWRWATGLLFGALALGLASSSYQYNIIVQRGGLAKALARIPEHIEPSRFPIEAADFLAAAEVEGKVLHYSAWGGYLLYKLWPRCSVFSDGRGNFDVTQVGTLVATHRVAGREETLEKAWRIYGFDLVVFQAPVFPLYDWDRERWLRIYAGVEHHTPVEVFLRNTPENQANLARVRAWYAANTADPRLASGPLADFEEAVAERWGRLWLAHPDRDRRLARYAAELAGDPPPARRAKALFARAMLFYNAGAMGPALQDLSALVTLSPSDARGAYYLGWALYRSGRPDQALGALMEAARREQERPSPQLSADERQRGELLLRSLAPEPGAQESR